MATVVIETRQSDESKQQQQQGAAGGGGKGLRQYYEQRIQDMQLLARQKVHDLQRLEAQRNDLNARLGSLIESGSFWNPLELFLTSLELFEPLEEEALEEEDNSKNFFFLLVAVDIY